MAAEGKIMISRITFFAAVFMFASLNLNAVAAEVTVKASASHVGKKILLFTVTVSKNCEKKCRAPAKSIDAKSFNGKPPRFVVDAKGASQVCATIVTAKDKFQCKKLTGGRVSLFIK